MINPLKLIWNLLWRGRIYVAKTYNNLAVALEMEQSYDKAIKMIGKAIKYKPDYINAYRIRSKLYLYTEEYDKVIRDAEKVIELIDAEKMLEDNMSGISSEDTPVLINYFKKYYRSDAYTMKGFAYWNKKDYKKAKSFLQKSLDNNPYSIWAEGALELLTNFKLTRQSLENLRKKGIPDNILESLKLLDNQEFTNKEEFLNIVETQIGKAQTVRYKELILKHATIGVEGKFREYEKMRNTAEEKEMMILKEHSISPEFHTYCKLTNLSFQKLKNDGVPDTILEKLKRVESREFILKRVLLNSVEDFIGEEETEQYKEFILKHIEYCEAHSDLRVLYEKYNSLFTEGMKLYQRGRAEDTIKKMKLAKRSLPSRGAEFEIGQCDDMIALALMMQGQYEEALMLNEKIRSIYKEIGTKSGEAYVLAHQGFILLSHGNYTKAIDASNNAIKLYKEIGDMKGIAASLLNLGICYMQLGDIKTAIEYHSKALAINLQHRFSEAVAKEKGNLASCYFELMCKEKDDAQFDKYRKYTEKYQNEIVEYYKQKHTDKSMELQADTALVEIQAEMGRRNKDEDILKGCLSSLDESIKLSQKLKDYRTLFQIFRVKGIVYRELAALKHDLEQKIEHLKASENFLREANFRMLINPVFRYELGKTYEEYAQAEGNNQGLRLDQAFACFEQSIDDIDQHRGHAPQQELRMSSLSSHIGIFNDAIRLRRIT